MRDISVTDAPMKKLGLITLGAVGTWALIALSVLGAWVLLRILHRLWFWLTNNA